MNINWSVTNINDAVESAQLTWSSEIGDYDLTREDITIASQFLCRVGRGEEFESDTAPAAWLALEILGLNKSTIPPRFIEGARYKFIAEEVCGLRLYSPVRVGSLAERLMKIKPQIFAASI